MKKTFAITVSSLALAFSTPATAQDTDATATAESEAKPTDPARISAARNTVDYLFPLGTYERMMKGTMDQMMDQMMMSMGNMRMGDLAGAGGVARGDMPEGMGDKTLSEMATEMDPHYEERTKISTKVIMDEMVNLMIGMEPSGSRSIDEYLRPQVHGQPAKRDERLFRYRYRQRLCTRLYDGLCRSGNDAINDEHGS